MARSFVLAKVSLQAQSEQARQAVIAEPDIFNSVDQQPGSVQTISLSALSV
jgi:hypothetical protein